MYAFNDVNKGLNNISNACINWHLRIEQHVGPGGVHDARDGACMMHDARDGACMMLETVHA